MVRQAARLSPGGLEGLLSRSIDAGFTTGAIAGNRELLQLIDFLQLDPPPAARQFIAYLTQAVNNLGEGDWRDAGAALFGVSAGERGLLIKHRRHAAADRVGVSTDHFRRYHERRLVRDVATELGLVLDDERAWRLGGAMSDAVASPGLVLPEAVGYGEVSSESLSGYREIRTRERVDIMGLSPYYGLPDRPAYFSHPAWQRVAQKTGSKYRLCWNTSELLLIAPGFAPFPYDHEENFRRPEQRAREVELLIELLDKGDEPPQAGGTTTEPRSPRPPRPPRPKVRPRANPHEAWEDPIGMTWKHS